MSKDDTDQCAASKVPIPPRASVEASTSFAITFIPVHAVAKTVQPALAGNAFFSVASSHSASWKRLNLSTPRVHLNILSGATADITESRAETIYVVGHSSGCAIANAVDAALKRTDNVVLVALDGFRPGDKQLDRTTTQVWGAECGHVKSRNFPGFDKGRRRIYQATDCKTMWALHFSLANAAARDHLVHSIRTGYAKCEANMSFI